ncbi:hypothetical protein [Streptomyces uncialis]|uniref:Uncharacterized protein n=1 Tax=Streptomyces uncialis TaxID=1048205 RepID=A0A1Q4UYV6_9ACTN|nr:hypothetical protein [Streptomyces uncialis]OKH90699.1 hypothetical protein AB852_34400 [Streptomyces uncialis]
MNVPGSPAIVVHQASLSGGRRVTVRGSGRGEILGTAYSGHDLVVFLAGAGVAGPEAVPDDPQWGEWRGGHAHEFGAGRVRALDPGLPWATGWNCRLGVQM